MRGIGKVTLIGAGPGDPDLLTVKAARLLAEADSVVYDRLVSDDIMKLTRPDAERISVGKSPKRHTVPQEEINRILVELAKAGKNVVRLKGGDPYIFGRGSEEAATLVAAGIPFEAVPGITAAQGASASAGIPLTHRGVATSVRYVTGHCKNDEPLDLDWRSLADPDTTLIVYMGYAAIAEIARRLIDHGMPADLPVLAIANATRPDERHLRTTLAEIEDCTKAAKLPAPVLFIVGRVVELSEELRLSRAIDFALSGGECVDA